MIDLPRPASIAGARPRTPLARPFIAVALLGLLAGCEFFAPGKDFRAGAGPKALEPYSGRASGSLRFQLQLYNGCGVLGDGSSTGPGALAADAGSAFTYPYPATCTNLHNATRPSGSLKPMSVVVGEPYYLDQFTIVDAVANLHTNPSDQRAPMDWFRTATRFKNLDWANASVVADDWEGDRAAIGGFVRTIRYGGANWMHTYTDDFLVEILDGDGNVVASMDYPRGSFALDNPIGGHTQFVYSYGVVGAPEFLGDSRVNPVPAQPIGGANVRPPTFRTMARYDVQVQTDHFDRTFTIPAELTGRDGVARVTWSRLPDEPFFFPLSFTSFDDPKFPQCWSAEDPTQQVPCDFGLEPTATFTAPANGKFYEPGETFNMKVAFKDGAGNLLHPPDSLPSFNEFLAGKSNGLLYQYSNHNGIFGERAVWSSMSVQGPIHVMKPFYGKEGESAWFSQWGRGFIPSTAANNNLLGGAREVRAETTWPIYLPPEAEPGTYAVMLKGNRQFLGERTVQTHVYYVQVGQEEKTKFPQRIGNCDICHSGPTSLSNIAMGMETGAVEACKACHGSTTTKFLHQVHMNSPHYPVAKHDCTVCHLKREGVLRASLITCNSCHQQSHAAQFFQQAFTAVTTSDVPSLQSRCAMVCHEVNPPRSHIIPPKRESP